MLANVHLYFFVEDSVETHVVTEQIEVLTGTELMQYAHFLTRYNMDGSVREISACHVNFEFA